MAASIKFLPNMPLRHARVFRRELESGNMMLEAVVGLAVGAILGLAAAWGAAQALHSQRFSTVQSMAMFAMRQKLAAASAPANAVAATMTAASFSFPVASSTATLTGVTTCPAPVSVTMILSGTSKSVVYQRPCSLSTNSDDDANKAVLGGDGVIQF